MTITDLGVCDCCNLCGPLSEYSAQVSTNEQDVYYESVCQQCFAAIIMTADNTPGVSASMIPRRRCANYTCRRFITGDGHYLVGAHDYVCSKECQTEVYDREFRDSTFGLLDKH